MKSIDHRFLCLLAVLLPACAAAQDQPTTKAWAIREFGEPTYTEAMRHWPWADPDAPKGGSVTLAAPGQTFDSLNSYIEKGIWTRTLGLARDTLMTQSGDEVDAYYGLIAESVEYPADKSWAIFTIREGARYDDGAPITAADFKLTWERLTNKQHGRVFIRQYYGQITAAEVLDDRRIKFSFAQTGSMKPITVAASLAPSPSHYWEKEGNDPFATYLDPPPSSGAYQIDDIDQGRAITYRRVADYWGEDLNVNRGLNNFEKIEYQYFKDDTVAFEAFLGGDLDFRRENRAQRWATAYEIPAVRQGELLKRAVPDGTPQGLRGMLMNQRRAKFADPRVRQALIHLYDFKAIQRTVLSGYYQRVGSYFPNSEYAAPDGPPKGREREILEGYRDQLPERVFGPLWQPPESRGTGRNRRNRREALRLLREAGYTVDAQGRMVNDETGEQLSLQFLLSNPSIKRVVLPYVEALQRDGIAANIRIVDSAQYQNRLNQFDFDVIIINYTFYPPPGPLLADRFQSASAARQGSANYAGIKDPVVDGLLETMLGTDDKETLVAATRALDRVLLWGFHAVPEYWNPDAWLAHWDRFGYPERKPKLGVGFPQSWWAKE